jgi:multiple antibiotic resistance protein
MQLLKAIVVIFSALFPIVNPLGGASFFLSFTRGYSAADRKLLARRIAFDSLVLLLVSFIVGSHVLAFFGVSLPIVQVGGGLIVIATAWELFQRKDEEARKEVSQTIDREEILNKAFYPLTLPLTVGPGSISVAITLGANAPPPGGGRVLMALLAALVASALIALSVFLCYGYADRLASRMGASAMAVVTRLSSFLLLCIGLQIVWNGVSALLRSL